MAAPAATRRALRVLILAVVAMFAFGTGSALANTFNVTGTNDAVDAGGCPGNVCPTLRDAVIAANANPGSTINVPAGTYNLTIPPSGNDDATTGDLNITAPVTIAGAGATTTFIDGGGAQSTVTDRVFRVEATGNLTLSGATIQHGHPAGADGGGILALGPLTASDATISGNFVDSAAGGPAVAQEAAVPILLTRVQIAGNGTSGSSGAAGGGGGLLLSGNGTAAAVSIADSSIIGNSVVGPGGGIYSTGTAPVTIMNTNIQGNTTLNGFTGGTRSIGGGGIAAAGGSTNPGWQLSGDFIGFNAAGASNVPNVPGGGIDEDGGDKFTVVNSTFLLNSASGFGGAYESRSGGTHKLTNVTIDENSSGSGGGSIDVQNHGTVTLANSIVSRGAVAGNIGNCHFVNGGALISSGHNLETADTCSLRASGDLINTDPKLQSFALNGGPTFNEALGAGSPAIDAGDNALCPSTDQRGVFRPQNGVCDIGAYEALHSITVTNTLDSGTGSLRDAIGLSGPGTTIDFAPALNGQTINLISGALTIPTALNIAGPGASNLTINGGSADSVFDVEASRSDDVTIAGLTITGGASSGPLGGGGITSGNAHSLTLNGDTITGNRADITSPNNGAGGGGVLADGFPITVINSTITGNTASISGAGTGGAFGGGGLFSDGGTVIVTGSVVSNNTSIQAHSSSGGGGNGNGGGGIYSDGGDVTVTNSSVDNNSASVDTGLGADGGGGIYSNGGTTILTGSTVNGNTFSVASTTQGADGGGGLYSDGGTTTITSSSIDGNSATMTDSRSADGGGGLISEGGVLTVTASSISENTGTVTIVGTAGVFAGSGGGAILDEGNGTTYRNSTLSDNSMTVNGSDPHAGGGAIHNGFGLTVSISDSTIAGNTANQPGGGIAGENGTVFTLKNTILARNSGAPAGNCAGAGAFKSAGFNLEDANTCGLGAAGDLINTDPKLGPLQNNGGPTPTQALPAGSPAIDAGSCTDVAGSPVATDQRGTARPQPVGGKCDIGAFELAQSTTGPPPPPPAAPSAQTGSPATKTSTGATLSGTVNPQGQTTTYFFEFGLDPSLRPPGASTALYDQSTAPQTLPGDTSTHTVSVPVSGLVPNALYHVRLVARNASGTTLGPDQTFTTPAGPPPPPPVLGQSQNAKPLAGHLFTVVNGQEVPLTSTQHLPSGTVLDARNGSLELFTAPAHGHKLQTGVFSGAIFKVTEARNGLTTLILVEGAFEGAPTYASCHSHGAADAHTSRLSSRVLQSLHSRATGRFRTRGRYAAGTVRGTQWTTTDRCDGTLIAVQQHSVLVTDFVKHITVLVKAGHHYLARARK